MQLNKLERNTILTRYKGISYSINDFINKLEQIGITKGDTICVHSQLYGLGIPECSKDVFLNSLCRILEETVGPDGTIIMPTFTYSFCENEVFDVLNSPSKVGILTEYFRNLPETSRTKHPIFSFAVKGKRSEEFLNIGLDAFDNKTSVYGKMLQSNDKIVLFGASKGYTFYYLAEQYTKVSHRYFKHFSGIVIDGNSKYSLTVPYYVRDLNKLSKEDETRVFEYLNEQNIQKSEKIAGGSIHCVSCQDMFLYCVKKIKEDEQYFLRY